MTVTTTEMSPSAVTVEQRRQLQEFQAELARLTTLPNPVIQTFSEDPIVTLDRRGNAWILLPAERDPLRDANGRHPLPAPQRRELQRLTGCAARFDRIVIGHDLDPDGPVSELLPILAGGPRTCSDDVARALVGPLPAHPGTTRAVRILNTVVQGGVSALAGAATVVAGAARDPIVFGVIGRPTAVQHGQPALWYPLTAWKW